jgi:hypothetical protein
MGEASRRYEQALARKKFIRGAIDRQTNERENFKNEIRARAQERDTHPNTETLDAITGSSDPPATDSSPEKN